MRYLNINGHYDATKKVMKMKTGAPIGWIFGQFHGMKNPTDRVSFEKKVVVDGNTKRIDVYIPETHVLIEQAGKGLTTCLKVLFCWWEIPQR